MEENNILENKDMEIINLGLVGFYDAINSQDVPCVHVDWQPPAGGNTRLIEILDKLEEIG